MNTKAQLIRDLIELRESALLDENDNIMVLADQLAHAVDKMSGVTAVKLDFQSPREAYLKFHSECTKKMFEISRKKNADYTGSGADPYSNFKMVEHMGVCSTEQGFLTRMSDKMSRIASITKQGKLEVLDESVEDTLLDLANYCILFAGYLRSKE